MPTTLKRVCLGLWFVMDKMTVKMVQMKMKIAGKNAMRLGILYDMEILNTRENILALNVVCMLLQEHVFDKIRKKVGNYSFYCCFFFFLSLG